MAMKIHFLITGKDCPSCKQAKQQLRDKIKNGNVIEIDIESPIGKKLDKLFNFGGVPEVLTGTMKKVELDVKGEYLIFSDDKSAKI